MNRKFQLLLFAGAGILMWNCSGYSENRNENISRMNVEKYFDSPDIDNISQKVKILNIFRPEFTDSSLFSNPMLLAMEEGKAYLHNPGSKWMDSFIYPDGKLANAFNHFGNGPEDYNYSYYAYFTPINKLWTTLSFTEIIQYNESGDYVRRVKNDTIFNLSPMANGNWLAFNKGYSSYGGVIEKKIYEYSSDWELINVLTLKDRRWDIKGFAFIDDISYLDGKDYLTDNDTVYCYDSETKSLIPTIAIILGKYSFDWSTIKTYEEYETQKDQYLLPKSPIFNSQYAWDYYYFGKNPRLVKFDMYDLRTGDLIYRRSVSVTPENERRFITEGFPVEIDGQTVYGNILPFVKDNHFFVCVPMDELVKIYDTDEVNPIIVEIDISD